MMDSRERILSLIAQGGYDFPASALRDLSGPLVYLLFAGHRVLYVGFLASGIERPMGSAHHAIGRARLSEADRLQCWPMASEQTARELERLLIDRLCPEWNGPSRPLQHARVARILGVSLARARGMLRDRSKTPEAPSSPLVSES